MTLHDQARRTLEKISNAALATVSRDGHPWNSPLFVATDVNLNFYWSSHNDAVHSRNIAFNPDVFLVLFDSTANDGTGHAVYVRAKACELLDEASVTAALDCLAKRKNEPPKAAAEFLGAHPRRLYQAVPEEMWTNVVKQEDEHYFDERVVIDLKPKEMPFGGE